MLDERRHIIFRKVLSVVLSITVVLACDPATNLMSKKALAAVRESAAVEQTINDIRAAKESVEESLHQKNNSEQQQNTESSDVSAQQQKNKDEQKEETPQVAEPAVAAVASLEDTPSNSKTLFAIYSADDNSLRIYNHTGEVPEVGDRYNGRVVTALFTDFDNRATNTRPSWYSSAYRSSIKLLIVEDYYKPTGASDLFGFAAYMTSLTYADVSNLDTSNATTLFDFFCDCISLQAIDGTNKWDTSKVTDIQGFLARAYSLKQLNISSWNTKNVTSSYAAFGSDNSSSVMQLEHIFVGENFDLSASENTSWLFGGDYKLPNYNSAVSWVGQDVTYAKLASEGGYLETAVCKIESTSATTADIYYPSVHSAIQAATGTQTITVFADSSETGAELDLTGKDITVRNEEELGSDWTGKSAITSWGLEGEPWKIMNSGTLTLDGVIVDGTSYTAGSPFISIYTGTPTLNIKGETELRNNSEGSAIQITGTSGTVNISDGKIYNNLIGVEIGLDATSAKLNISGGTIENNQGSSDSSGGIRFASSATIGAITISGSPVIKDNSANGTTLNVETSGTSTLQIDDLTTDANVGIYSTDNYTSGAQFATGVKDAKLIANLSSTLKNDRDSGLSAVIGADTAIVWGNASCKVVSTTGEVHYGDLGTAITEASDGDTIEIYKSHSFSGVFDTTGKNLTIKNITNPKTEAEDPKTNGSTDEQPVVTYGTNATRILINSNIVFEGIVLDGDRENLTYRITPGVTISASNSLTIKDGVAGKHFDGSDLAATSTEIRDFYNCNGGSIYTGGGFAYVSGTMTLESGTIRNCQSDANSWKGGGAVCAIGPGGIFNMHGGMLLENGPESGYQQFGDSAIHLVGGKFNMTDGTIKGNKGSLGGVISSPHDSSLVAPATDAITISGGLITENTTRYCGGFAYIQPGMHMILSGDVEITNNVSSYGAGAICLRSVSSQLTIKDNVRITGNKAGVYNSMLGGAIESEAPWVAFKINISGSPYIYDNGRTDTAGGEIVQQMNIVTTNETQLYVDDLGEDAKIGYYSTTTLANEGQQFATGVKTAATIANLEGAFINDKNTSLTSGIKDVTSTAIVWFDSVCKIDRGTYTLYFSSLASAISGSEDGDTIEILKSHSIGSAATSGSKNLTIKNVTNPAKDSEDPTKDNGSVDQQPVVYFTTDTSGTMTDGRLTFGDGTSGNILIQGVHFSGQSWDGSSSSTTDDVTSSSGNARNRGNSGIAISAGCTVTIEDGVDGQRADGTTLPKTETVIENFVNTTTGDATSGGFCYNNGGNLIINSGTYRGCKCDGWHFGGGGAVAATYSGTTTINGGIITENGELSAVDYKTCGAFKSIRSTFTMTGGEVYNNKANHGGLVAADYGGTLTFTGGKIHDNEASLNGGAIVVHNQGAMTLNIGGDTEIYNNSSGRWATAIDIRDTDTLNLSGNAKIYNNYGKTIEGVTTANQQVAVGPYISATESGSYTNPTITITGNPQIYNNVDRDGVEKNVWINNYSRVSVSDLGADANIGIYAASGLAASTQQFAVGSKTAAQITNLGGAFTNDKDATLVSSIQDTTSTAIIWAANVCKIERDGYTLYYDSLASAVAGAQTGETIEILKSHTTSGSIDTTGKDLTIKNVTDPVHESDDPSKNGSDDAQPVVKFASDAQLQVNSNVALSGVIFEGQGPTTTRSTPGMTVGFGYTLNISDGVAGTITKTDTILRNFTNTSNTSGGGLMAIYGTVNMTGGTITGCYATAPLMEFQPGGGDVAILAKATSGTSGGVFNFSGGKIDGNGRDSGRKAGNTPILVNNGTFNMTGGTISNNKAYRGGGVAANSYSTESSINISGGTITNNTTDTTGGAIYDGTSGDTYLCTIKISGSPYIYDNKDTAGNQNNVTSVDVSRFLISDLGADAKIGFYEKDNSLCNDGVQFATADGEDANKITNLTSSLVNDINGNLQALSGGGTKIIWGTAVCKLVTATGEVHFTSLSDAIDAATGAAGERIEIYKSHAVSASMDTTGKDLTIKNITDPKNDEEDPSKNNSSDVQPVVTYGSSDTRLVVNSNITLEGLVFDGNKSTLTSRTVPGATVNSGYTLTIKDGVAGKHADGTELAATSTEIRNFKNTSTASISSGGGFAYISGTLNLESGTISGCEARASEWKGGGAVCAVGDGGVFNMTGGTLSGNGSATLGTSWGDSAISLVGGIFNMTDGIIRGNQGSLGGVVTSPRLTSIATPATDAINVSGGLITENTANYSGGFAFVGPSVHMTLSGDTEISNNVSNHGAGAICLRTTGSNLTIKDNVKITGNKACVFSSYNMPGGAIEAGDATAEFTIEISGSPYIMGNGRTDTAGGDIVEQVNLATATVTQLMISDLGEGAKVGVYSRTTDMDGAGEQFATANGKDAKEIANLTSSFVNDKDSTLKAVSGGGTKIIWGDPVCKLVTATNEAHFADLATAISEATSGATGERIEIYKSHTVSSSMDTTGKDLTIKNITDPSNDSEDPNKNGSDDAQPVVKFATEESTNGVTLNVSSTITLSGVIFDGQSLSTRKGPGIKVNTGYTLNIHDGEDGALSKTETVLKNFTNVNNSVTGGALDINGTVNMTSGTITGCWATAMMNGMMGGGDAVCIGTGGLFNLSGGKIYGNGKSSGWEVGNSTIFIKNGTFNMTAGTISNNKAKRGGGIGASDYAENAEINISGGTISLNYADDHGGGIYVGGSADKATCTITLSGSPYIYGNTDSTGANDNVTTTVASKLLVEDLGVDAKIGFDCADDSTLCDEGVQFATANGKEARYITNLTSSFVNDKNANLLAVSGAGSVIKWGTAVCKLVTSAGETHYGSLVDAITNATSGATDEVIEIYKSHNVSVAMDTTGKDLKIKNITDPKTDEENPTKNGSTDTQPVVKFDSAAQLQVKSTITLSGVIFDGQSDTTRTIAGMSVAAGSTLNIVDGESGTLTKTDTLFQNFVNTSTASMTSGGGLLSISGTVNMSAGKMTGCYTYANVWSSGGGDVASIIASTGVFNMSGGEISSNGRASNRAFANTPILVNYGKFNMTDGKISDNVASCGGAVAAGDYCVGAEITITGGEICNNTADRQGGAVFIGAQYSSNSGTCKIGGDVYIHDNKTLVDNAGSGAGSAVAVYYNYGKVIIEGSPRITNNTSTYTGQYGAAITGCSAAQAGTITISGSPYIRGNTDGLGAENNVCTWDVAKFTVGDLGEDASIGFYSATTLCDEGVQFSTGLKDASKITNLTSSFVNDKNSSLKAVSGGGTKIIWGDPVCKLVTATNVAHYANLATAISDATAGATGERIEIYKSHTVSASMDTTDKPLTIMNITDPASDMEDPTKNSSADAQPVITFTADGRLLANSDIELKGVLFDGSASGGGLTTRTTSAIAVTADNTLTIKDGDAGALAATETKLSNFYNATGSNAAGGGCLNVLGTVNMESGTITGCKSESGTDADGGGGGAAALILSSGTFNFKGGAIKSNGEYKSGGSFIGAISMFGGTFNMTGGVASDNMGNHGGFISCWASNQIVVNITGGQLLENRAYYDGGALYFSGNESGTTYVTATIGGNVVIAKNYANRSGSAIATREGSHTTITGNAVITKNSTGGATSTRGQSAVCSLHYANRPSIVISGSPVIRGNTNQYGTEANVNLGYADDLTVGVMNADALVGYTSENGLASANTQFANSNQASAADSGYLNTFVNDRSPNYLGTDGGEKVVKWPGSVNANIKVSEKRTIGAGTDYEEEVTFVHLFETLKQAFDCIEALSADNMVDGAYTAEVLIEDLTHSEKASLSAGSTKPVVLTTASTSTTDGYAYRGTAGTNATIKRAYNGASMITAVAGADGSITNLTIKDVILNGNNATYSCSGSGGALSSLHAKVTLSGAAQVINNSADGFSAIEVGSGTSATAYDDVLYIQDSVIIKDNVNSASTPSTKAGAVGTANNARTFVSGSIQIYDNKDASSNQQNLFDGTSKNDGSQIYVASTGLNADAKIGVYATNNYKADNIFARSETTPSKDYSNLEVFSNDRMTGMKSEATYGDGIMWESTIPITIRKTIPAAQETDTWFVVKVRKRGDYLEYRQAVKVEAGQTEGEATLVLSSGEAYDFIDVDSQSTWRYETESVSTSDLAVNDSWTLGGAGDDFLGRIVVNPDDNDTHKRTIILTTKVVDDTYVSDTTNVMDTIK